MPQLRHFISAALLLTIGCAGKQKVSNVPPPEPATADWVQEDKFVPMLNPEQANPLDYSTQAQSAINGISKKVQRCYKRELKSRPRLHGEMVVAVAVEPTGAITRSWVSYSTVPSLSLEACILPLFQALELPPPGPEPTELHHPYVFTSKQTPPEIAQALKRLHRLEDPESWADEYRQTQEASEFDAPW